MTKQDYVPPKVTDHGRVIEGTLGRPGGHSEFSGLKLA